ncbi:MAG: transglycosylase SLT domain-containing protein [Bacteroidota bacterium]
MKHLLPLLLITLVGLLATSSCQEPHSPSTAESPPSSRIAEQDSSKEVDAFLSYNQYDEEIKNLTQAASLDWMLVKAVIIKESHFDVHFISTAGAVGLMQLMPRKGSFISEAYQHFSQSRRQKRNSSGERIYRGKKDVEWAAAYTKELDSIRLQYQEEPAQLYAQDARFDPSWNLHSGITQLSNDYQYFRRRGHGSYGSRIYALAAYNAGRGAVVKDKTNRALDRIPINRQTELYVGYIERIYAELKKADGLVREGNAWVLKI